MKRVNKILQNRIYVEKLHEIEQLEEERIFCGHGLGHVLDVARIAYIENLEKGLQIPKDLIYGTALLHDIGRGEEYLGGRSHEKASAALAEEILAETSFNIEESKKIVEAIKAHRVDGTRFREDLAGMIYRADKKSRCCMNCKVSEACNWSDEKKNHLLEY